tara:strand:+ start:347 stop:604 length:258 start_codon:yes stop_codon:yes gene_type:complete
MIIRKIVRRARKQHTYIGPEGEEGIIRKGDLYEETTAVHDCDHNGKQIVTYRHPYVSQAAKQEYLKNEVSDIWNKPIKGNPPNCS